MYSSCCNFIRVGSFTESLRLGADIFLRPGCVGSLLGAYHVESNDIFERYFTGLVLLNEDLVNLDGR
jgi:hypothetical protein